MTGMNEGFFGVRNSQFWDFLVKTILAGIFWLLLFFLGGGEGAGGDETSKVTLTVKLLKYLCRLVTYFTLNVLVN